MSDPDAAPPAYPSMRQSLAIAGVVFLMIIACSPLILLRAWIGREASFLVYYLTVNLLSFYIAHGTRKRGQGSSRYDFRIASWRLVPLIALVTIGLHFGVAAPLASLIPRPEWIEKAMRNEVFETGLPSFLCAVIAAPILEELIFRGIMLDGLLRRYRPRTAILLSSLLFGFVHLNPWQFVMGTVLGCFLGWVYARTGSVGCCIIGHMSANGSGYIVRLIVSHKRLAEHLSTPDGLVGSVSRHVGMYTALLAWLAFWLAWTVISVWLLRRELNTQQTIPVQPVAAPELPGSGGGPREPGGNSATGLQ